MEFDTIILGGGAAGLMCAAEAGKRGRKTAVIEKSSKIGKKILISGGGRCNFTNIHCTPSNFISENPHFCKSALSRFTPFHFIELVERHKIAYHEKTLGQQFCDGSSKQIVKLLRDECEAGGVKIFEGTEVGHVEKGDRFNIQTSSGNFSSTTLVIATGGLSIPKMGATDFGHRIAKKFGLSIVACRPGLVPLTFSKLDLETYGTLSGISLPAVGSSNGHSFKESILFTHRGLSGPAVLQISSYWREGESVSFNLLPESPLLDELLARKVSGERAQLKTVLAQYLPKRLAEVLSEPTGSVSLSQVGNRNLQAIADRIHKWTISPDGTEGYAKAEVTVGGVDTKELSSKTMESNRVPGLFFIGEAVDVTGHLGGFNFQWAWASGHAAGQVC